jgi:hypothetical protein
VSLAITLVAEWDQTESTPDSSPQRHSAKLVCVLKATPAGNNMGSLQIKRVQRKTAIQRTSEEVI